MPPNKNCDDVLILKQFSCHPHQLLRIPGNIHDKFLKTMEIHCQFSSPAGHRNSKAFPEWKNFRQHRGNYLILKDN
jgi:hypothetical protein